MKHLKSFGILFSLAIICLAFVYGTFNYMEWPEDSKITAVWVILCLWICSVFFVTIDDNIERK